MNRLIFAVLLLLVFNTSRTQAADSCAEFFESLEVQSAVAEYQKIVGLEPIWADYQPDKQTVSIYTPGRYGNCIVEVTGKIVREIVLNTPLENPTFVYYQSRRSGGPMVSSLPEEYIKMLEHRDVDFLFGIPLTHFREIADLRKKQPSYNTALQNWIGLIVHEGFHLFVQDGSKSGYGSKLAPWPQWDRQPKRSEVFQQCYLKPSVKELAALELKKVQGAVRALLIDNDEEAAKQLAREYNSVRIQRQKILSDVLVPGYGADSSISCAQAEGIMEHEEGIALFVEWMTALSSGTTSVEDIVDALGAWQPDDEELFYPIGAAKMLMLKYMKLASFRDVTFRIARSGSWEEGLQLEFEKLLH